MGQEELLSRTQLLLGESTMKGILATRVILFGIGGVGSWTAETLIRSGIRNLTIVDADVVCESNINRQLMATIQTIGQPKVEALKQRLLCINPEAEITAIHEIYSSDTAGQFHLDEYDYIIDCIDSLSNKALLILNATAIKTAVFFSSMGAALKLDPTRVRVTEFWKVEGCPLAARLRGRFRKTKQFPLCKFQCVYSDELLSNMGESQTESSSENGKPMNYHKVSTNGSLAHITGIFGLTLTGLLLQDIAKRTSK